VQVLLDFPAFVSVFLGFFGPVFGLAEGMLAITYGFTDYVQRFCHNLAFLSQGYTSFGCANFGALQIPADRHFVILNQLILYLDAILIIRFKEK